MDKWIDRYTCKHIHKHTHMCVFVHLSLSLSLSLYIYIYIYIYIFVHAPLYIYKHSCLVTNKNIIYTLMKFFVNQVRVIGSILCQIQYYCSVFFAGTKTQTKEKWRSQEISAKYIRKCENIKRSQSRGEIKKNKKNKTFFLCHVKVFSYCFHDSWKAAKCKVNPYPFHFSYPHILPSPEWKGGTEIKIYRESK